MEESVLRLELLSGVLVDKLSFHFLERDTVRRSHLESLCRKEGVAKKRPRNLPRQDMLRRLLFDVSLHIANDVFVSFSSFTLRLFRDRLRLEQAEPDDYDKEDAYLKKQQVRDPDRDAIEEGSIIRGDLFAESKTD